MGMSARRARSQGRASLHRHYDGVQVDDRVIVTKESSMKGKEAVVTELNWGDTGRVKVQLGGATKSYLPHELEVIYREGEDILDSSTDGAGSNSDTGDIHPAHLGKKLKLKPEEVTAIRLKISEKIVKDWKTDEEPFSFRRTLFRPTLLTLRHEARHLAPKGARVAIWLDLHSKYALRDIADSTKATEAHAAKHYDSIQQLSTVLQTALELVAHSALVTSADATEEADGSFRLARSASRRNRAPNPSAVPAVAELAALMSVPAAAPSHAAGARLAAPPRTSRGRKGSRRLKVT